MKRLLPLVALATLLCGAGMTAAADLARIDRTVKKEPVYQGKPKYGLLVFGPEARIRVWLVLDGTTVYLDRKANGDLTEAGSRVATKARAFKPVTISGARDRTEYEIVQIESEMLEGGVSCCVEVNVKGKFQQLGDVLLAGRPEDAPVLHFNGPLSFLTSPAEQQPLVRGDTPTDLHCRIATQGPAGGAACIAHEKGIPANVHPEAVVEFPSAAPGRKPVRVKVVLTKRC